MSNLNFIMFSPSLDSVGVVDLAVSYGHACALFSSLYVVACWGGNNSGALGVRTSLLSQWGSNPGEMSTLVPIAFAASLASVAVVQIVAGESSNCGIDMITYRERMAMKIEFSHLLLLLLLLSLQSFS